MIRKFPYQLSITLTIVLLLALPAQSQPQIQFDPEFLEVWGEVHVNWDDEMPQIPWVEFDPHFFSIRNTGDEPLVVEDITTNLEEDWWLYFDPFPYEFEIAPGEEQFLEILIEWFYEEEIEFNIIFHCNDPDRREAELPAFFHIEYNPPLAIIPSFIEEMLFQGEQAVIPIRLINDDDQPVEFFFEVWVLDQPDGANEDWLTIECNADVVRPNDQEFLTVILNSADQPEGHYEAELVITTDNPEEQEYIVGIEMWVEIPEPRILLDPDHLEIITFFDPFGEFGPDGVFNILSVGNTPLIVESIQADVDWLFVDPNQVVLGPDNECEIDVWYQPDEPLEPGDYEAAIMIRSNDENLPHIEMPVQVTIQQPPHLLVDPMLIEYSGMFELIEEHVLNLANIGDFDLRFIIFDQIVSEPEGNEAEWLTYEPSEGRIPADQDLDVIVTLNPEGAMGGEYETELQIISNDPENPEVVVLVYMEVIGVPVIEVVWSEDAGYPELINWNMAYLDVYTGGPYEIPITICNQGTAELVIDDISTNHEYFTTDFADELTLEVGEEAEITITFEALFNNPDDYQAVMTILSNDPDEEELMINLHANAFNPPVIMVDPRIVEEEIFVGEMNENILEVSNDGGSVLRFNIERELVNEPEQNRIPRRDQPEGRFALFAQSNPWGYDLERIFQAVDDLDYERFRDAEAFEEVDLFDYDVIWIGNFQPDEWIAAYNDHLERIEDWVDQGGVYYMCTGTRNWEVAPVHPGDLVRIERYYENVGTAVVDPEENYLMELMDWEARQQFNADHFCHTGYTIESLENIRNNNNVQVMVIGQEQQIPIVVQYNFGLGHCVISGTTDGYMHAQPERYEWGRSGEAMLEYLDYLTNYNWLTYAPREGELEPGDDMDICVTLDASGRLGGEYEAELHFLSNDPGNPDVVVQVSMTVGDDWRFWIFWPEELGWPEVINFNCLAPELYTGFTYTVAAEIVNLGVNDLQIEDIICDNPYFYAEPNEMVIEPGEQLDFEVIFQADEAGDFAATLVLVINDPDQPMWETHATAECIDLELRHFPELEYGEDSHRLTVTDLRFDGERVSAGWEIGVFTPDGLIAGSAVWIGNEWLRIETVADDPDTDEIEGFRLGESFTFRAWDDVADEEFGVAAEFEDGPQLWVPGGESRLALREGGPGFTVRLRRGWNMMSIAVDPPERYYAPGENRGPDIELMMEQFRIDEDNSHLLLMKDESGNFYVPGPEQWHFLNIPYWNLTEGYQVKLNQDFVADWQGAVIPADADVPLENGWNTAAYFPTYQLPCDHPDYYAFTSILENLIIAKDEDGHFCLPEFNYSDIPPLSPGKGYQIKVDGDVVLNYPPEPDELLSVSKGIVRFGKEYPHWQNPLSTGECMSVLVTQIHGSSVDSDDQIGVFGSDGLLVGAGYLDEDGRCGIAVWGDDPTTDDIDGLQSNETLKFVLWENETKQERALNVGLVLTGNAPSYAADDILVLELELPNPAPSEFYLDQNYPNPFNAETRITFGIPTDDHVSVAICDITGRLAAIIADSDMSAGHHSFTWEAGSYPAGVYLLVVQTTACRQVREMVLLR